MYASRFRFVLSPFTQENRNILKISHGGEPCKTLGIQVRNGSSLWICEASGQTAPWLVFSIVWSSVPWGWEEGTSYCQPLSSGGTLKESRPLECVSQHRASRGLPRPTVFSLLLTGFLSNLSEAVIQNCSLVVLGSSLCPLSFNSFRFILATAALETTAAISRPECG